MLDCAVRCSASRRLCAELCCVLQHRPEAVCWPVLVLQHTERLWRCQTQLCAVCTLDRRKSGRIDVLASARYGGSWALQS